MRLYIKISLFVFFIGIPLCPVLATMESENIILKVSSFEEEISKKEISEWVEISTKLVYKNSYNSEIENINFCHSQDFFCFFSQDIEKKYHLKNIDIQKVNHNKIETFLTDLARRCDKDPVNAKLEIKNEKVVAFAPGKNGIHLDIAKSIQLLSAMIGEKKTLTKEITLPFTEIEPKIKEDKISQLGINNLIGEGKSNFSGSPKNRIHNIKVATGRFDGILLAPGEEFSFVEILGEVDGEHGYLPELVIKNDKTEPEFGGGICQVSTTVFRAAIYSGLEITARRNHAYPVSYYNPQGMDATIYVPLPDLRFINNTPGNILIQTKLNGTELIFQFYGTDDGRVVKIDGPHITERNPDSSMKTYFTQKVTSLNGKVVLDETFRSNYDSPNKYPHPGQESKLTEKPEDWSKKQWNEYKKANGI
ncbi:MAG: VanW family protein [Candidatus Moranbacteria bacterium GW2011_GWE2_35_2-]|nr:MAG: VanW family protein [Candidatus Moranbacteria bacterium GW2011_GWE2_35_2-]KKQ04782.1 MAG: VanW family protein [Candidatus Moranbacteria bacterium GW2011_GWF1_36_4]KKQ22553.1 MAG: VanW family protein [Candidatus Moranbacteria bacterium GW2011_GWF2_37_11]KKQ29622.1 MAG: VanW family protein [Candidatus Moranbacteria bacterium GW2011_GWD1_37_17]KKQ30508.1 MAG: VanW family protein [Candidatus Moranbacteria bacterium GW2011_GWE1_37_24]KKQ46672.1 MAG: VanW family protein [Candidatus Moranbact